MTSYNRIITTVNSDSSNITQSFTPSINNQCILIDTFYNRIGINTIDPQYEIDVSGTINSNILYANDISINTLNVNRVNIINELSFNNLIINNNLTINNDSAFDVININCNKLETNDFVIKKVFGDHDISAHIKIEEEVNEYKIFDLSFNIYSVVPDFIAQEHYSHQYPDPFEPLFNETHDDYFYNKITIDISRVIIDVGTEGSGFIYSGETILDVSLIEDSIANYPNQYDSNGITLQYSLRHKVTCKIRLLNRDNNIYDFSSNLLSTFTNNELYPSLSTSYINKMLSLGVSSTIRNININTPIIINNTTDYNNNNNHYPFVIDINLDINLIDTQRATSGPPMYFTTSVLNQVDEENYGLPDITRYNLIIEPPTFDGITGNVVMPSDIYLQKLALTTVDEIQTQNVLIFQSTGIVKLDKPGIHIENTDNNIVGRFVFNNQLFNNTNIKEWSTEGGNLNLYDGLLSCGSIDISFNNNFITIDSSNIKNNDQLNIISDTLNIESSNCNINIINNLNIDTSNVLIDSSNITLSGELIKIIKKTLINDISFIDNTINSNNLEILANKIAKIICENLNITTKTTTINGNTTFDGSINIVESNGSLNKYAHVPIGTIVMWNNHDIPNGWALCDGSNNTPDLRHKFIKGGTSTNLGNSSYNEEEIELTKEHLPDHIHNITYNINSANDSHYHNYDHPTENINTTLTDTSHDHSLNGTNVENVDLSHSHSVVQQTQSTGENNLQHTHILGDHSHNIATTNIDHEHYIGSHTHDTEAHFHSVSDTQTTDIIDPDFNNNAILITNDTNNDEIAVNITTLSNNILEGGLLISEPPKNDTPMDMFNNRTGKIIDQNWISHHSDVIDTGGLDTINHTHHTHNVSMQSNNTVTTPADLSHHHTFDFPKNTETEDISHTHLITGNTDNKSLLHNHTIEDFSSTYYDHSHNHVIDVSMSLWPGENRVDYPNPIKKLKIVPSYYCLYYIMKIAN